MLCAFKPLSITNQDEGVDEDASDADDDDDADEDDDADDAEEEFCPLMGAVNGGRRMDMTVDNRNREDLKPFSLSLRALPSTSRFRA